MADSYIWKDRRVLKLKHGKKCIISLRSFLKLDGICKIEFLTLGNYLEKCPVRIWKRYIPLLIDLLISNNFSSMTFFRATHILRVIGRQSIRQSTDFFTDFLA